jgi:hypothetical protein
MQRIETLLQKIQEMSARGSKNTVIDIDLMLDYVKVVYADLLEMRSRVVFTSDVSPMAETKPATTNEPVKEKTSPVISTIIPDPTQSVVETLETPAIIETVVAAPITEVITAKEEMPVQEKPKEELKPAEQYTPPARYDIRQAIGINDKYLFISELFKDNKDMYEKTLDELNKQDSYDDALDWLNENVLFTNDVEGGESETVQLFYDTVNKFFSER